MTVDWQQGAAFGIVALAALAVGRRMWGQIAAFGNRKPAKKSTRAAKKQAPPPAAPLIQIQTKPPAHLRRPPSD